MLQDLPVKSVLERLLSLISFREINAGLVGSYLYVVQLGLVTKKNVLRTLFFLVIWTTALTR